MITFHRFDEINHLPLQVYNRVMFANALVQDGGPEVVKSYLSLFDEGERVQISIIQSLIQAKGVDYVRKLVTNGLEIVDENVDA